MATPAARVSPWKESRHPPNEGGLGSHPIVQIAELINKGHLSQPGIFCEGKEAARGKPACRGEYMRS